MLRIADQQLAARGAEGRCQSTLELLGTRNRVERRGAPRIDREVCPRGEVWLARAAEASDEGAHPTSPCEPKTWDGLRVGLADGYKRGDAIHILRPSDGFALQYLPFLVSRPHALSGVCTDGQRVFVVDEVRSEVQRLQREVEVQRLQRELQTTREEVCSRCTPSEPPSAPRSAPRSAPQVQLLQSLVRVRVS